MCKVGNTFGSYAIFQAKGDGVVGNLLKFFRLKPS